MRHRNFLQNEATFQSDLNNILHRVLDVLGVMAVFGIGISMARTVQLDDSAYMWNAALVIAGVFGGFFFRAEKYLAYRGLFLVGIHLVATGFGIFKLGLLTPGLYALPFFIALGATLFNRVVTALLIAGTAGLLVLAAVFHGSGGSTFLNGENVESNANPRNWFVALCLASAPMGPNRVIC